MVLKRHAIFVAVHFILHKVVWLAGHAFAGATAIMLHRKVYSGAHTRGVSQKQKLASSVKRNLFVVDLEGRGGRKHSVRMNVPDSLELEMGLSAMSSPKLNLHILQAF
jgi:hypothetical protein